MEWQPIETAPLDGTALLLFIPGQNDWSRPHGIPDMAVGLWAGRSWISDITEMEGYESTGTYIIHPALAPTHWMPLPEPPATQEPRR